jgi:hypothetical protein
MTLTLEDSIEKEGRASAVNLEGCPSSLTFGKFNVKKGTGNQTEARSI